MANFPSRDKFGLIHCSKCECTFFSEIDYNSHQDFHKKEENKLRK